MAEPCPARPARPYLKNIFLDMTKMGRISQDTINQWMNEMPYHICFFEKGIVPFNRNYVSLNQQRSKDKSIYGGYVKPPIWLYDDGTKPWYTKHKKQYYKKLEEYLPHYFALCEKPEKYFPQK